VKQIEESILDSSPNIKFEDIQGLDDVKSIIKETIILPTMRPDIFKGLLSPSKGILLYGPPGNGKTMMAKAIATECKSTFFNISASTLTSKWMGEGERLMRALFTLANERAPSVIFMDEIDAIMSSRGGNEHEASRRMKTEFLVQFDGVSSSTSKILVLAATNRPFDLDEAALRRLTKRIYLPLPDIEARKGLVMHTLSKGPHYDLDDQQLQIVVEIIKGYSGADITALIKEAAMVPVRELTTEKLMEIKDMNEIRQISLEDIKKATKVVTASVSKATIDEFEDWRKDKGAA